jgi:hypothetical protein
MTDEHDDDVTPIEAPIPNQRLVDNLIVMQNVTRIMNRLADREGELSILSVALELLAAESGAFALFMRLGDHGDLQPGAARAFAIAGDGMDDPKLVETITKWSDEQRPTGDPKAIKP